MISAVSSALSSLIGMIGDVISAIVTSGSTAGAMNALLPVFAIGIACSVILFGIHIIRKVCWGA